MSIKWYKLCIVQGQKHLFALRGVSRDLKEDLEEEGGTCGLTLRGVDNHGHGENVYAV